MVLSVTKAIARVTSASFLRPSFVVSQSMMLFIFQFSERSAGKRDNVYNILWVLVFGFATINILALVARRFEPRRSSLQFGEMLAITVTVVSVVLLGWEMLSIFHIFPIRLQPH
jgi:ABC-type Mn2+/Zn2+ transport system permease subunit